MKELCNQMMRLILVFFGLSFFACSHEPPIQPDYGSSPSDSGGLEQEEITLLRDKVFNNGIKLNGNNSANPTKNKFLYPFGGEGKIPSWELGEWSSRYLLSQDDLKEENGFKQYQNKGKLLAFKHEGKTTDVKMGVTASEEYDRPRQEGEEWVHLLFGQSINGKPKLENMSKLYLYFTGRLIKAENKMVGNDYDPSQHTAQFQMYMTIQDLQEGSPGYGDYIWFGIPFYDYRSRKIGRFAAQDAGKSSATGKYIFSIGTEDYMSGSFHDNSWVNIKIDLKPFMLEAVEDAKEKGYLKQSPLENLKLADMNIGWEVPGTFDVEFEFKGFDITYIKK